MPSKETRQIPQQRLRNIPQNIWDAVADEQAQLKKEFNRNFSFEEVVYRIIRREKKLNTNG